MKKSVIILIAVVAVIIIWAISAYNGLVSMDENVSSQWANVETQYQRRADLSPIWSTRLKDMLRTKKRLSKEL